MKLIKLPRKKKKQLKNSVVMLIRHKGFVYTYMKPENNWFKMKLVKGFDY